MEGAMSTATEMSSFLSGKFHHVDVDRIEKELLELWEQAGKAEADGEPSVTRACSMNFILCTSSEADVGADMLEDITLKHPCRAILAHAIQSNDEHLEAFVTARCRLVSGKKSQICCEQINVRWQGQGTRPLASVVLPLRIADLPTWLWWHKTRPAKEMIGPFLPFIDRLIVDTADMNGQLAHLFDLKDVFYRLDDDTVLYDLNWTRLLPWRQSVARAFHPGRGLLSIEDIDLIDKIDIEVSDGQAGVSIQALLMVAWLATRLSWKFVKGGRQSKDEVAIEFSLGRRRIHVVIRASKCQSASGSLNRMALEFVGNPDERLVVSQDCTAPGLLVRISGK